MKRAIFAFFLILVGLAAFVAYNSYFIVDPKQTALVVEFGNPQRVIRDPGLYWKIPVVQNVEYFDKRILDLDVSSREVTASDQKRLVVDAFARYRIINPLLFFQSVTNEQGARARIETVMDAALRSVLGSNTFIEVVKDKRDALMRQIAERVNNEIGNFGMEVVDVRIKRADLPNANSQAIYDRMKTEREQEASQIRALGEEQQLRIRAQADREVLVIEANARRDAEVLRGEGDAERNRIYAEAFSRDADFFGFYRSMQAYEQSFKSEDTRLVISPTSDFFRYFNDPNGGASTVASGSSRGQTGQVAPQQAPQTGQAGTATPSQAAASPESR